MSKTDKKPGPVMLGFIHAGVVRTDFMRSVLNLGQSEYAGLVGGMADVNKGALIAAARNLVTAQFMASDQEWLWFVDTDITFAPSTIKRLLDTADPIERPIVGALAYTFMDNVPVPIMFNAHNEDGLLFYMSVLDWEEGELVKCDGIGAGCVLIHRSVFEKIQEKFGDPYPWHQLIAGGNQIGEDFSFCIRAGMVGCPIYVDTSIQVGHTKTTMLGEVSA